MDLHRGTVCIRRTFSHKRVGPTKTGREREVSFLHPVSVEGGGWRPVDQGLLERLSKVQGVEPTQFIFGGARPLGSMAVNRLWQRTLTRAKVRYRVPEQLRHTLASTLLSRNAPLTYVQRQGGWRSASTLLAVYSRWVEQAEAGAKREAGLVSEPDVPARAVRV